jgi:hypothetical protein
MPSGLVHADDTARNSFYERQIAFTMRSEQGQLVTITAFPTDAGPSLEYKYKTTHRGSSKHQIKIMRSLLVDSVAYSLNFIPADQQDTLGLAGAEQRSRFYNSLIVKP